MTDRVFLLSPLCDYLIFYLECALTSCQTDCHVTKQRFLWEMEDLRLVLAFVTIKVVTCTTFVSVSIPINWSYRKIFLTRIYQNYSTNIYILCELQYLKQPRHTTYHCHLTHTTQNGWHLNPWASYFGLLPSSQPILCDRILFWFLLRCIVHDPGWCHPWLSDSHGLSEQVTPLLAIVPHCDSDNCTPPDNIQTITQHSAIEAQTKPKPWCRTLAWANNCRNRSKADTLGL